MKLLSICLLTLISLTMSEKVLNVSPTSTFENLYVKKGETFSIKLKANPTTGYNWYLRAPEELNENVAKCINLNEHNSGDYQVDPHPEGYVGVGGTTSFKFVAGNAAESSYDLNFVYKRPWVADNKNDKGVTIKIIVTN